MIGRCFKTSNAVVWQLCSLKDQVATPQQKPTAVLRIRSTVRRGYTPYSAEAHHGAQNMMMYICQCTAFVSLIGTGSSICSILQLCAVKQ